LTSSVKLEVRNFGYVEEASIELAPLTIFIGKNNTGKSYIATLIYILLKKLCNLKEELEIMPKELPTSFEKSLLSLIKKRGEIPAEVRKILEELKQLPETELESMLKNTYRKLLKEDLKLLIEDVNDLLKDRREEFISAVEEAFVAKIEDLVRRGTDSMSIKLTLEDEKAILILNLAVDVHKNAKKCNLEFAVKPETFEDLINKVLSEKRVQSLNEKVMRYIRMSREENSETRLRILESRIQTLLVQLEIRLFATVVREVLNTLANLIGVRRVHYLPASRAGILHGYRLLTRRLIEAIPSMLVRGGEIPRFTGVVADFISELLDLEPRKRRKFVDVYRRLEEVLEGGIELIKHEAVTLPEIVYSVKGIEYQLTRVSSMIAELAPLDLFIKYGVVHEGDALFIEEPEAHLHPDAQAKIAEVLALLAKKHNVKIVVTTHSDIFLYKLSNLVMAGSAGLEDYAVTLTPQDVRVYHFEKSENGSVVKEVPVTETGIPDDAFRKVIEDLYEEHMNLYYRLQEKKASTQ